MKRVLCLLLCSIAILFFLDSGKLSEAGDWLNYKLKGTYATNTVRTCLRGPVDAGTTYDNINIGHGQGDSIYNGDGTGTLEWTLIAFNPDARISNIWYITCEISYIVHDNVNFTQWLTCDGIMTSNPPGFTFHREGIVQTGVITQRGNLLLLSDQDDKEELNISAVGTSKSVCGRTITAVRIDRQSSDDDDD